MAKLVLTDLVTLVNDTSAVAAINANSAATEAAMENTLSRDGTAPNSMAADLDMDSNQILNLPTPVTDAEPATKGYVDDVLIGSGNVPGPDSGSGDDNKVLKVNGITWGWEDQAALDVTYDNTSSGMAATTVKGAIDELNTIAGSQMWSKVVSSAATPLNVELTDDGTYYLLDSTSGTITVNMPAIGTTEGARYAIQKIAAGNLITIVPDGTDTINGTTSYTLTDTDALVNLISDDASPDNWIAVTISQTLAGAGLSKTASTISLDLTSDQSWTGSQRVTPTTDADGSFDMNAGQDFLWTPVGVDVLEFTNMTAGQRGMIYLTNTTPYAITTGTNVVKDADFESTASTAGTYVISYWATSATNTVVMISQAVS